MRRNVCAYSYRISNGEDSLVWVSLIAMGLSLFSFITIMLYFYGMANHLKKLQDLFNKRKEQEEMALIKKTEDDDYEKKL